MRARKVARSLTVVVLGTTCINVVAAAPLALPWLQESAGAEFVQPAQYKAGHDAKRLCAAAAKLPTKTVFETEGEFRARLQDQLARPVYGAVALDSRLVLRVPVARDGAEPGLRWRYDAEKANAYFFASGNVEWPARATSAFAQLRSDLDARQVGKPYDAMTAGGARLKVTKIAANELRLLGRLSTFRSEFISPPIEMDAARASALLPKVEALVIGRAVPPYGEISYDHSAPTFRDPYEINHVRCDFTIDVDELVFVSGQELLYRAKMERD